MSSASPRPAVVCQALLAALEASEGRRRSRKRDQTPDAIGLQVKRELLESAVAQDPDAGRFEEWLLIYARSRTDAQGAALAMATIVLEEWRLAQAMPDFAKWLARGAPSADAAPGGA
jgi:hypothetical protein